MLAALLSHADAHVPHKYFEESLVVGLGPGKIPFLVGEFVLNFNSGVTISNMSQVICLARSGKAEETVGCDLNGVSNQSFQNFLDSVAIYIDDW